MAAAAVGAHELVVEIGPGLGTLTRELARVARRVIAIEKDQRLESLLQEVLGAGLPVELLLADALQVDYQQLVGNRGPVKVVANLPYYITTPLITRLLEQDIAWSGMVFLVQAEVAERIVAGPGSKEYGLLSIMVQWEYEVERITRVPPSAFYPAPKVASAVVKLCPRAEGKPLPVSKEWLGQVLRAALGQRRKTLLNALIGNLAVTKEEVQAALSHLGLEEGVRGEELTPEQFIELAAQLL